VSAVSSASTGAAGVALCSESCARSRSARRQARDGRTSAHVHLKLGATQKPEQHGTVLRAFRIWPSFRLTAPLAVHVFHITCSKEGIDPPPRLHGALLDKDDRLKRCKSSGDSGAPRRVRYWGVATSEKVQEEADSARPPPD